MKTLNFEQMECVIGGGRDDNKQLASKICGGVFLGVGIGLGAIATAYTAGAAAWSMFGFASWLGGVGYALC